jgi:hypothetical protein
MRTAKFIVLPLLAFYLLELGGCDPALRFTDERANSIGAYLTLLLPSLSVYFAIRIPRDDRIKAVLALLVLPIAGLAILIGGLGILLVGSTPIQRVQMNGYIIHIAETDCGAPCPFGIIVWQEKEILPGISLVRRLWSFEPTDVASCTPIGKDTVLIRIPEEKDAGTDNHPAQSKILHLKPAQKMRAGYAGAGTRVTR